MGGRNGGEGLGQRAGNPEGKWQVLPATGEIRGNDPYKTLKTTLKVEINKDDRRPTCHPSKDLHIHFAHNTSNLLEKTDTHIHPWKQHLKALQMKPHRHRE